MTVSEKWGHSAQKNEFPISGTADSDLPELTSVLIIANNSNVHVHFARNAPFFSDHCGYARRRLAFVGLLIPRKRC